LKFVRRIALGISLSLLLHALVLWVWGRTLGEWPSRHAAQPSAATTLPSLRLRWQNTPDKADSATDIPAMASERSVKEIATLALAPDLQHLHAYYFSATELDRKPHLLQDVNPSYPQRVTHQEAVVVQLRLLISAGGRVDHAIVESLAVPMAFAEAAIDAFSDARFAPGLREQQAVPSQMRLELRYTP
jgi:hypothetical protein